MNATRLDNDSLTENDTSQLEADGGGYSVLANPFIRAVIIITYLSIFTIGVIGNSIVVYIIIRTRNMHTITNMFITNLAISDITMCLLSVPFTPLALFMDTWVFGEALCHIIPMTMAISVYVSTLTSTAIAIDRYFVIVHPFLSRMRKWVCLLIIISIWCVSILISLPLAIYQKVSHQVGAPNGTMDCMETWPKDNTRKIFTLCSFCLQFCFPGIVIAFCYSRVNIVLKRRLISKISRAANAKLSKDIADIRRKRRTNRMLIAMICAFCTAWSGLNALHIAVEFDESIHDARYFVLVFLLTHATATSSTNYNPFLYAWMNETFRNEMRQALGHRLWSALTCACCRRKLSANSNVVTIVSHIPHSQAAPVNLEKADAVRARPPRRNTKETEGHANGEKSHSEGHDRTRSHESKQSDENGEDGDTFLEEHSSDDSATRNRNQMKRKEYHALPALLFGNGLMHAMTIGISPADDKNRLTAKFEQYRKLSAPFSTEESTTSSTSPHSSKQHASLEMSRSYDNRQRTSPNALKCTKSNGFVQKRNPDDERNWSNPVSQKYLLPSNSFPIDREAISEQISPVLQPGVVSEFRSYALGTEDS